jgi:cobalt-zinc-cadmium efflux system membrane fusion protein
MNPENADMSCIRLPILAALLLASAAILSQAVSGHGSQIKVGGGARGPVSLTAAQIKALGLETVTADLRPVARLLSINGQVAALPDAQAEVSLRISGIVQAVYVNLGDSVRKGQKLALVQSRAVGNPPPTIPVVAPMDGLVDSRGIIVGQTVEPNSALFQLSERARMRVVGKVYEEDLGKVKAGQKAYVKLLAYPNELLNGTVSLVGPMLDPETRTVEVWVLLDNKRGLLKPNLFARADIVLGQNEAALTVPNAAILEANGEKFVFVHQGEKYDRVDVTLGAVDDQYSEVLTGIVPGDEVVTQGAREIYTLWLAGGQIEADGD